MLPISIIASVIPSLINVAEDIFKKDPKAIDAPSRGPEKKDFVMGLLKTVMDAAIEHDIAPPFVKNNQKLILSILSSAIEIFVKAKKQNAN